MKYIKEIVIAVIFFAVGFQMGFEPEKKVICDDQDIDQMEVIPSSSLPYYKDGDKGDTGDIGIQGERGFIGLQGSKGDEGDKGDKGDKPIAGIDYLIPKDGDDGDQGKKGDKGDKGESGDLPEGYWQGYCLYQRQLHYLSACGSWGGLGQEIYFWIKD